MMRQIKISKLLTPRSSAFDAYAANFSNQRVSPEEEVELFKQLALAKESKNKEYSRLMRFLSFQYPKNIKMTDFL